MALEHSFFSIMNFRKHLTIWLAVLVVLAAIIATLFYLQAEEAKKLLKASSAGSADQTKELIKKVGELIELPGGETPTVATVTDVEKLKGQAFFAKAQKGDKVLIFEKAGKAVLYRPSTGKIIEYAPINIESQGNKSTIKKIDFKNLTVAIYTAPGKSELAVSSEKKIKDKYPEVNIVTKEEASSSAYQDNIAIDLVGGKADQAEALAGVVGGRTGAFPEGELRPDADILIIVVK